ncbi:GATA transcription factor 27-like isoform X2 [Andrographis paniculata]|uniref:GATA transcription factor 27-like isoform X2 n=1 Tax=Andrographis paniculata TaxID=175694 RepID=UPI0021E8E6C7|nr:GATA transcription factor 27-like isoform X2 [Andrographis paniculata]
MVKHGPCCHCGVTATPLWRNGPPEKPVLCNACGSRWRTKGTLANYAPMHARSEQDELEDYKIPQSKNMLGGNKKAKGLKRMHHNGAPATEFVHVPPESSPGFPRVGEDMSNRSSSGSAISNSESCAQYSIAEASDMTGASQPLAWDSVVPSRKRTCITRPRPYPVEKLAEDLYTIWHEQQSSCLTASSEEDLLLESDKPMVSVEIGHGSILIRHPSSIARDEESEASSLSFENKQQRLDPQVEPLPSLIEEPAHLKDREVNVVKKDSNLGKEQEKDSLKSSKDKDRLEIVQLMMYHKSPLCFIDLQDIVNLENFAGNFTYEEQQRLLKLLPSVDTVAAKDRDSAFIYGLRGMFDSPQFKDSLLCFQNLLEHGLFDHTLVGTKLEDCLVLKKFVLCNAVKSKWVEKYKTLKDSKGKDSLDQPEAAGETITPHSAADSSAGIERPHDQHQNFSVAKSRFAATYEKKYMEPKCRKELLFGHNAESSEQDLLLDVPSNASFPQAELLVSTSSSSGGIGGQATSACGSSVYPKFVNPG